MATLEHHGRLIGYEVKGDGPAMLAFHGTTQSSNAWDQVLASMTEQMSWVCVEFPGSGSSSLTQDPLQVDDLVSDGLAVMDHLGHSRFHVAGYSLGAVVALRAAAVNADRVDSVISLCGWSRTDARMRVTFDLWRKLIEIGPDVFMRYAIVDGSTAAALEAIEPMFDMVVDMAKSAVQPGSDAQLELDARIDIEDSLGAISCPALIIGAFEDRWVDIEKSRHMARIIDGSVLAELPAGHLVINELAADVARLISTHVAK